MSDKKLLLAFDVDGVLLDYTLAFADTMRRFGVEPRVLANSYHCHAKFGFDPHALPDAERERFFQIFDQHGWLDMPSIEGAREALLELSAEGHSIRYLTSMPAHKHADRILNLAARGFPEAPMIATGHRKTPSDTPKAQFIDAWQPDWLIDDWAHNFKGISAQTPTRFALILDGTEDHPNLVAEAEDRKIAHAEFPSARAFATALLGGLI